MPLQQLVEYFNDRFGLEHHTCFRPLILEHGQVSGLFGPVRVNSNLAAIRQATKPEVVTGYAAQISVATYDSNQLGSYEIENLLAEPVRQTGNFESIINFDRLARTVHMLNYLPLSHQQQTLFLDVDPRHILGVQKDHGAYFEEVITRCGLQTGNVAIVTAVNNHYSKYYQALLNGLDNYRQRGYKIALRLNDIVKDSQAIDFIEKISPHYVSLFTRNLEDHAHTDLAAEKLRELRTRVSAINGKLIMQQVYEKKFDVLARKNHFDLVEGAYYRTLAFNYESYSKTEGYSKLARHA